MAGVIQPPMLSWKDNSQKYILMPWRTVQMLFPGRIRRRLRSKLRSRVSPASSISTLKTSFSPADTLKTLNAHRWTIYDAQYLLFIAIGIFALCVVEHPPPVVRALIGVALLMSLLLPVTCQFFLPAIPIISWLVFFYTCQ